MELSSCRGDLRHSKPNIFSLWPFMENLGQHLSQRTLAQLGRTGQQQLLQCQEAPQTGHRAPGGPSSLRSTGWRGPAEEVVASQRSRVLVQMPPRREHSTTKGSHVVKVTFSHWAFFEAHGHACRRNDAHFQTYAQGVPCWASFRGQLWTYWHY